MPTVLHADLLPKNKVLDKFVASFFKTFEFSIMFLLPTDSNSHAIFGWDL